MDRILALLFSLLVLNACFIEDTPIEPHQPGDESLIEFDISIYEHLIWFDLNTESIVKIESPGYYHLGFETAPEGYHIRLNSANNFKICRTGSTLFEGTTSIPDSAEWRYDASTGDLDSTAIGNWVSIALDGAISNNEVYLLGLFNGLNYQVYRKIQFLSVDSDKYTFRSAELNGNNEQTFTVWKDTLHAFVLFSFDAEGLVEQPHPNNWDLLFTPYYTTLYTDDGIPTPYNVRGILINEERTLATLDTLNDFATIDYQLLENYSFTNQLDAIGHEWKYYNGEDYVVTPNMNFVVKDTEGYYFKFRFVGYHNAENEKGFPSFELQRL